MAENTNLNLHVREGGRKITYPVNQAAMQEDHEQTMTSAKHPRDESQDSREHGDHQTRKARRYYDTSHENADVSVGMDDLPISIGMPRQKFERDIPQTSERDALLHNITLAAGESTREHWWVSYHTAHQRYVSMAIQGVRIARPSGAAPRYTRIETAQSRVYMSSVGIAKCMNRSQRNWIAAERERARASRIQQGISDDSDSVRELEERYCRALSDVPINILQFPRRVSSGPVLVASYSRSPFDELPELRASWYAKVYKRRPRGFMPDYCDKNEGDMHFIDVSAAVDRQQLEERENAQPINDETKGVDPTVAS